MNAHTRDNCLICGLADQETREAMQKWKATNTENDWERVRSAAANRRRHQTRHRVAMQSIPVSTTAGYPVGYDSDPWVYPGGAWELGKNR